jgi:hypothetical protein
VKRVGRSTFRKLFWLPLLCMGSLLVPATMVSVGVARGLSAPWALLFPAAISGAFWVWLLAGRLIASRLLLPLFVSAITCPGCEEEIDAVGVWNCTCGYRDHRERHLLAGSCPACSKGAGYVVCPRCDCTILLW